ncbi:hypothetical protein HDU99_003677 [Rhizoclosmatium hyalinum]|nr:hypothetical protein HDU99_003677 [Rhizoclosmatium hyalinum]
MNHSAFTAASTVASTFTPGRTQFLPSGGPASKTQSLGNVDSYNIHSSTPKRIPKRKDCQTPPTEDSSLESEQKIKREGVPANKKVAIGKVGDNVKNIAEVYGGIAQSRFPTATASAPHAFRVYLPARLEEVFETHNITSATAATATAQCQPSPAGVSSQTPGAQVEPKPWHQSHQLGHYNLSKESAQNINVIVNFLHAAHPYTKNNMEEVNLTSGNLSFTGKFKG